MSRKGKEAKGRRKESYGTVLIFSCIASLILRVPLIYMTGEKGVAFGSFAIELYVAAGCFFTYGFSSATASLVRYRVRREQYGNAARVLKNALIAGTFAGILCSALLTLSGPEFAKNVLHQPVAGMCISIMAPAIVFEIMTGVWKGYFEGNGSHIPSSHSIVIKSVVMITASLISTGILYRYGQKVSALLQDSIYAAAYGAIGISIGILISSVVGFLHILFVFLIYRKSSGRKEQLKNQDRGQHIFRMLMGTALPFMIYALLGRGILLLDGILFIRQKEGTADTVLLWGNYYGKCLPVLGIMILFCILFHEGYIRRIIYFMDREEFRMARERMAEFMQHIILISFPVAVFTAVFSENLLNLFFKGNNASLAQAVATGSILIPLFAISYACAELLVRMRKMRYVLSLEGIAAITHGILMIVLLQSMGDSLFGILIAQIVPLAVFTVLSFILVLRGIQYRIDYMRRLAFPAATAAAAGLVCLAFNKLLSSFAGSTVSMIICIPVGIVIYIILLLILKAISEDEIQKLPLAGMILFIGKLTRLL